MSVQVETPITGAIQVLDVRRACKLAPVKIRSINFFCGANYITYIKQCVAPLICPLVPQNSVFVTKNNAQVENEFCDAVRGTVRGAVT